MTKFTICFSLLSALLFTDTAIADDVHMANGIKIGEVTSTSAIIWMRLTENAERNIDGVKFENLEPDEQPEYPDLSIMKASVTGKAGEVKVKYWPAGKPEEDSITDWVAVDGETDFTHQFTIEGLQPDTSYEVLAKGRTAEDRCSVKGKFKTAPSRETAADVTFVVTTCGDYPRRDDELNGHVIYRTMLDFDPDFFVHTGDAEYYDRGAPQAINQKLARFKWNRI